MIINSLLDNDFYKFTMGQVVLHKFPGAMVEYKFKCRTPEVIFTEEMQMKISEEIDNLCNLEFSLDELKYLSNIRFLKQDYIEYLRNFKLNRKYVYLSDTDGEMTITIVGPWISTILFEVPILAIVSEVYMKHTYKDIYNDMASKYPYDELNALKAELDTYHIGNKMYNIKFADFGTRRRFSRVWQEQIVLFLVKQLPETFTGTSNVLFAKNFNLVPVGTMAHEFIMGCQSMVRLSESQKFAFQTWADEYRGDLGIALSDTLGIDAFLRDFDLYFCKLFDGVRQDSGDPVQVCEKVIQHYKKMKIDPRTKRIVFSDGLDFYKMKDLYDKFKDQVDIFFGIGTYLTNNIKGTKPIQIVIKMTKCNDADVAKISDSEGKQMCENIEYLNYLKGVFKINGE